MFKRTILIFCKKNIIQLNRNKNIKQITTSLIYIFKDFISKKNKNFLNFLKKVQKIIILTEILIRKMMSKKKTIISVKFN